MAAAPAPNPVPRNHVDCLNISVDRSGELEASSVSRATPGRLLRLTGYHVNAARQFLMVFNATSVPANGAVTPVYVIPLDQYQTVDIDEAALGGREFNTGICWCLSTTGGFTKTLGAAEAFVEVGYV